MIDDIIQDINPYSLFPFLAGIANFSLALLVYLRDRRNPVNITFALLNLCTAVWNFSLFKVYSARIIPDEELARFWFRMVSNPSLTFFPPLFLHFVLAITNNFTRRKKKLAFATYALSFVLFIIAIYDKVIRLMPNPSAVLFLFQLYFSKVSKILVFSAFLI